MNNSDLKKNLFYKNGDRNFNLGKKIQSSKWFKICIFSLIMLGILSASFLILMNNPKYVIKQSIIKTLKKLIMLRIWIEKCNLRSILN